MCRHYAPRYVGQCAHDRAERVVDKKKSNFCTYFRPRPNAHLPVDSEAQQSSQAELRTLFGDGPTEEAGVEASAAKDIAMGELADVFGLESDKSTSSQEDQAREALNSLFGEVENSAKEPPSKDHRVFVYGTLKRGFPNHDRVMTMADYLGRYRTFFAYPLVVAGVWFSPYLIDEPGMGHCVTGELYCVDDEGLAQLDAFEGLPGAEGNRRVSISVHELEHSNTEEVWTYVKDRDPIDIIHGEPMQEYDFDRRYVAPWDRPHEG